MPHDHQRVASLASNTRLVLREVTADDARAFRDFVCEPAFWTPLPIDPPSLSSIRAHLEQCACEAAATPRTAWAFAAVESATGRVVGEGSLRIVSRVWRQGEIGWGVDPSRFGEGLGTAVAAALLRHAFASLGLHRIVARCRPDNAASRAIMAKLGFREEGLFREDVSARGEWWDSVQAAILDREWREG